MEFIKVLTTNLELGKYNGIFYVEKLTAAIIDHLIHHSFLLVFTEKKLPAGTLKHYK
ncbi:ATP-binding protein [Desulfitobacterium sp. Sab5]|uniref:ATP-binding protein n=1 Tax=Desulfitobacterium nosdiversum TaxID=3375356 RepID=UPI003CFA9F5C